ncbi:MBG domain-containing protein, partial [Pararcticibacter amylolyticus]
YDFTYVDGTLTVGKAMLTITADNKSRIYGAANPALTVSYSGFVNGDTPASITAPSVSTAATTASAAGTYPITASGATSANYNFTYVNGVLTVGKAVLTITADNKTKIYGAVNPGLTVTYSGFVNGDTPASITAPSVSTTATTGSAAGTYPIVASSAASANYTFTYVDGTLTVGKAMLTISADNKTRIYGAANPALTVSYSGFVNGDTPASITVPSVSTTATAASAAGTYPIVASGAASANYDFTYVDGTLTVGKAMLTITADNKSRIYGAANPALTVS